MSCATVARAVGSEERLRCLDLDFEAQGAAGSETVRVLDVLARARHRLDLLGRGDLGERHDEPVRQGAGLAGRDATRDDLRDEQREGAHAAPARRLLEALDADARERRRGALRLGPELARCRDHRGVLGRVVAVAEPVLEVDPEVLDRLDRELRADALRDGVREVAPSPLSDAQQVHEPTDAARAVDRLARPGRPLRREAGRVPVARHVDGVHGAGASRRRPGSGPRAPRPRARAARRATRAAPRRRPR